MISNQWFIAILKPSSNLRNQPSTQHFSLTAWTSAGARPGLASRGGPSRWRQRGGQVQLRMDHGRVERCLAVGGGLVMQLMLSG